MAEIPGEAVRLAGLAIRELNAGTPEDFARAALEAAEPILAEAVAAKILAHAERQFPKNDPAKVPGKPDLWRTWHRHFGIGVGDLIAYRPVHEGVEPHRAHVERVEDRGLIVLDEQPGMPLTHLVTWDRVIGRIDA